MIESITISTVATFSGTPKALTDLSKLNYFFGANGTGKTTISRVVADEASYPTCSIAWKGGTRLKPMVYNRDFVDRNFNQLTELKGVFTLGAKEVDTLEKIAEAKSEMDSLTKKIELLTQNLNGNNGSRGKKGELATLEADLKEKCWIQKLKHDAKFQGAFEGYRNNQEKFKGKVLHELASNVASLLAQADLEKKAEGVFGPTPTTEAFIAAIDPDKLLAHETNPILKKRVIGRGDVDIAAMIKKLGNSDWVREGLTFYKVNDEACPFCQQSTTSAFTKSLNEYFDETFVTDSNAIEDLATNHDTDAARVQQQIAAILTLPSRFLDASKLKSEKDLLAAKITLNKQRIAGKKKEASQTAELESLSNVLAAIASLISSANNQVSAHNKMVANLTAEKAALAAQVWRFVLEELRTDLAAFNTEKGNLDKAIAGMRAQLLTLTTDKSKKAVEIRELEKQTTSVQPTIDGINSLLTAFGFQSFKLAKAGSGTSYKLLRTDGSDAKATLSEGEKTFVTFLYFYQLLKGSESDYGITTDRVVVFDDPVSSLDSDILFVVSSLIKHLFDEVRAGTGYIKQVFVLTHNVYFHKEVTYNSKRRDKAKNDETFWIVRRQGVFSTVERHSENPVKTSYELLWSEIRKPDRANLTIQNTLRRVLENYFKILAGIDLDSLCSVFDGKDKVICKSLCSWMHDGSHNAHDDLYISIDDSAVDAYLRVFRAIFKNWGHEAHYKMMMGDAFEEEPANSVSA